jgi:hypothetical protein
MASRPVTAAELSQCFRPDAGALATLRPMPTLYVMTDSAGPWPVLRREVEAPQDEPDRRWRFVAEVEEEQAVAALELTHQRRVAGEL